MHTQSSSKLSFALVHTEALKVLPQSNTMINETTMTVAAAVVWLQAGCEAPGGSCVGSAAACTHPWHTNQAFSTCLDLSTHAWKAASCPYDSSTETCS
jgi:hypothetical protein